LFFTQEARLILEHAGAVIYKDASANKGGVTSSSLEVLAALSLHKDEYDEHMRVSDTGKIPEFYEAYVKHVQRVIEKNARLEFECIWTEHERGKSKIPRSELTNLLSNKINALTLVIKKSKLWEKNHIRTVVLKEALPPLLVELVGFERLMERIPLNYQRAIFATHLASNYVYENGLEGNEFSFFEFMERYVSA